MASLPGLGLHSRAELPALRTSSKGPLSRPVGPGGLLACLGLHRTPSLHFKSPLASAEQPHHGDLSSLFALLESLSPVIVSPATPSSDLQPSHTHGTALISLLCWACPFPRALGLHSSEFPPICLHCPHAQGHSAAQWPHRRDGRESSELQQAVLFPRPH